MLAIDHSTCARSTLDPRCWRARAHLNFRLRLPSSQNLQESATPKQTSLKGTAPTQHSCIHFIPKLTHSFLHSLCSPTSHHASVKSRTAPASSSSQSPQEDRHAFNNFPQAISSPGPQGPSESREVPETPAWCSHNQAQAHHSFCSFCYQWWQADSARVR